MMKKAQAISNEMLEKELKKYNKNKINTVVRHALSGNPISSITKTQDRSDEIDYSFSIDIKTMPVTNQKQSGRCWIFAALNVLREIVAKKCNMTNFELSQSYVAFYDKLEKINFELEAIIDLIDTTYDDRTLTHVLNNTIGDGGQWDMFVDVVNKYGVVPKNVMIETCQSSATYPLNSLITVELNKFAAESKELYKEGGLEKVKAAKEELLSKMYSLLVSNYGLPVKKFDFEYVDKDNKYHLEEGFTPLSFYEKYLKEEVNNFVSIINAPTESKPFGKTYTIDYLGNVVGGKEVTHLNVSMDRMIELILAQLKEDRIVWFGSDVSFYRDRTSYAWDDKSWDYQTPFDLSFYCDKGKALDFHISAMNHAMCITGVNLINGVPNKWKIQNSWGSDVAKQGYYLMSDTWFNQYTYQAVVDKKYLSDKEKEALNKEPIRLKPWDPMGSLAD